jgi:hypothetical protein
MLQRVSTPTPTTTLGCAVAALVVMAAVAAAVPRLVTLHAA